MSYALQSQTSRSEAEKGQCEVCDCTARGVEVVPDVPTASVDEDVHLQSFHLCRKHAQEVREFKRQCALSEAIRDKRLGDFFKRGDVARVLSITPKEAGRLLQGASQKDIVHTRGGWWTTKLINKAQPLPQPSEVHNVFGSSNRWPENGVIKV